MTLSPAWGVAGSRSSFLPDFDQHRRHSLEQQKEMPDRGIHLDINTAWQVPAAPFWCAANAWPGCLPVLRRGVMEAETRVEAVVPGTSG